MVRAREAGSDVLTVPRNFENCLWCPVSIRGKFVVCKKMALPVTD